MEFKNKRNEIILYLPQPKENMPFGMHCCPIPWKTNSALNFYIFWYCNKQEETNIVEHREVNITNAMV